MTFDSNTASYNVSFTVSNPSSVSFTASAESSDSTVASVGEITKLDGTYEFDIENENAGVEGTATVTIKLTGTDDTVYDTHTISVVSESE